VRHEWSARTGVGKAVGKAVETTVGKAVELMGCGRGAWVQATYAGWQTNRGLVLADMGNYTAALAAHDRAIEANPNVTVVWSNRAGVYEHLKRCESTHASPT
jgi:tetratricopeptide (TPR) repeat protein